MSKRVQFDADDLEWEAKVPKEPKANMVICAKTGKRGFTRESKAAAAATNLRHIQHDSFIKHYLCAECGMWHLGHPAGTRRSVEDLIALTKPK